MRGRFFYPAKKVDLFDESRYNRGRRSDTDRTTEKMRSMQSTIKKKTAEYAVTVLLAAVMAFNYILFIVPNSFAPAGLNGIATDRKSVV